MSLHLYLRRASAALLLLILSAIALPERAALQAQSMTSFANQLAAIPSGEREAAIDSFIAQLPAIPWIDGDTAHFLFRDELATEVLLAGDFNFWTPDIAMSALSSSSLWSHSRVFEHNARLDYKIVVDGSWILDPANPNTVSGGFGPNSELAMPGYVQPWEIEDLGAPAGAVSTENFSSSIMGKTYELTIYLPPGYDPLSTEGYPSAYFQDGHEYVGLASANLVFDNLLDSGLIEPVIGVFVRPTNRNEEYAFSDRDDYADFFATELVPYIDATYNTQPNPERRAVIGPSFGGNISARIGMAHPYTFANLGIHSGAFWPEDGDTYIKWLDFDPPSFFRVANIYGTYEGGLTMLMQDWSIQLAADGVDFIEDGLPEGHSWGLWRSTLDDMLVFFFPPEGRTVGLPFASGEHQGQLFPNPSPGVIFWEAAGSCQDGTLSILGMDGREQLRAEGRSGSECAAMRVDLSALPSDPVEPIYPALSGFGRSAGKPTFSKPLWPTSALLRAYSPVSIRYPACTALPPPTSKPRVPCL
jgi:enterochelin esterase family protein